jgi:acyl carrier protein
MYATGDLVRQRAGGELEFVGRIDHQVKIRGFRIELGDIESALRDHPAGRDAVVVARPGPDRAPRLIAYVAVDEPGAAGDLGAHLARALPPYMVPSAIIPLDRLPLSPNGKIDRERLPAPSAAPAAAEHIAPAGVIEELVAELFGRLLGQEPIGALDHFFDLGGHSLLVPRLITELRDATGLELPLRIVFEAPTVRALAARVVELRLAAADPDERARLRELEALSDDELRALLAEGGAP